MIHASIHDYIKSEENRFQTEEVQLGDNWHWSFRKHVQMIFHLKHGIFFTGENNWLRAFKEIMAPILDLNNWTEDIDVKDVLFFIESKAGKVLSFLLKKYHDEVYVREHDLETLFDNITEDDNAYGGVIVQSGTEIPETLPLISIAFCDQTDILGGPIGFKHYFSPDKLRGMKKWGWGEEKNGANISLEDLCILASADKSPNALNEKKNNVTGKTVEVYIVRGNLPEHYLKDNNNMEDHYNQVQVVAFYTSPENKKEGVILYRKKEEEGNLDFFASEPIYQRALGSSIGEKLLGPQIWTNFLEIHKMNMLEAASKIPLQTDDQNYTTRNKIQEMENLEITVTEEGKSIRQIPTAAPANLQLLEGAINQWFEHSQFLGAAFDPIMGKESSSGTTFRGQERTVAQGKGSHDRKRGKRAKFIEKLYREKIIPDIKKKIMKGKKFLAELTSEELNWIAEQMAIVESNEIIKDVVLYKGKAVTKEEQDLLIQIRKEAILKQGTRQLVEILEGEFEDVEIKIGINVANKQKDLANLSDKLLSIFQFIFANPAAFQQAMQIPALSKAFENLLEFGGLSIGDFSTLLNAPVPTPMQSPMSPDKALIDNQVKA